MRLYRSKDGRTYHRPECRIPGERHVWDWALYRDEGDIWVTGRRLGVHPCGVCQPIWLCPNCNDIFTYHDAADGDVPPLCSLCLKATPGPPEAWEAIDAARIRNPEADQP